ncbi:hypothetical protein Mapa_015979 [Marchantia paleacea]|nr:hypothetical protein Mapa_015979 [Marchantia paleacea]
MPQQGSPHASSGVQDTKLEIHGCDGQSYHAVLQTRFCIDDGFPATLEQQMVEFPVGNAEYVKQFLLQYSLLRRKEGFVLRHDSLSAGTEGSCLSDRVMVTSAIRLPKQLGHSSLPDMLCTSSEKRITNQTLNWAGSLSKNVACGCGQNTHIRVTKSFYTVQSN